MNYIVFIFCDSMAINDPFSGGNVGQKQWKLIILAIFCILTNFVKNGQILATLGRGEKTKTISFTQLHIFKVKNQISKRFGQPFGHKVTKSAILDYFGHMLPPEMAILGPKWPIFLPKKLSKFQKYFLLKIIDILKLLTKN